MPGLPEETELPPEATAAVRLRGRFALRVGSVGFIFVQLDHTCPAKSLETGFLLPCSSG